MESRPRQLLKVLNGPHAGCELLLADGDYTVGADDANDIVLTDELIAASHARVSIRGDEVHCEAAERLIRFNGAEVESARLPAFQPFTLGETHLAIGPADEKWPAIGLPRTVVPEASEGSSGEDQGGDERAGAATPVAPAHAVTPQESPTSAAETSRPQRQSRGLWAAVVAFGLLFIAFLGLIGWLAASGNAEAPTPSRELQQAALQTAVAKLGHENSISIADERGRFVISGYVPAPADKRAVREAILALDPTARIRIYDSQSLVEAVDGMLRMYKLEYSAVPGQPGEVIVRGTLTDRDQWTRVRDRIQSDLPQLATLTEDFANVRRSASPRPNTAAAPAEAADSKPDQPTPASTIAVAPPRPPAPQPQSKPKAEDPTPGLPPIQSINVGNTQSITLANGEHLYRGAVLPSGYVVSEIHADRVVLTRAGRQHIIRIGI